MDPLNQARRLRLIVQREAKRARLFTRNGHDWTDRYPRIVKAALRNRSSSFVIDGEAVLLDVDGTPTSMGCTDGLPPDISGQLRRCASATGHKNEEFAAELLRRNARLWIPRGGDGLAYAPAQAGH